jgi:hypothetical protein
VQTPLLGQLLRGVPRAEAGDGDVAVVQERAELGHVVVQTEPTSGVVLGSAYVVALRVRAVDEDARAAEAERDGADRVGGVVGLEVAAPPVLGVGVGIVAAQRDEAHDEGRAETAAAGLGEGLREPALGDAVALGEGGVEDGQVAADPEDADVAIVDVVIVAPPPYAAARRSGLRQGDLHGVLHCGVGKELVCEWRRGSQPGTGGEERCAHLCSRDGWTNVVRSETFALFAMAGGDPQVKQTGDKD